jgi:2-polyprenyl-3-methyl-5-hydroxy-6-metoxy-1,4-benzoquinol methylase
MHPTRPCPICETRWARRIWWEDGYAYVRCHTCSAVFADLLEAEYERARHNAWDEDVPTDEALAFYGAARERVHAEFLNRNPPRGNGRLLDIGCGLGFFLARAKDRGWDVHGVDTSASWVSLANARLDRQHRVHVGTVGEANLPAESFDLITAWDVIEHTFDPVRFLTGARELMAPQGRLFIRTPNISYGYPVYAVRRWVLRHDVELGPTNHVVYFTAATLTRALLTAGLRPVEWSVYVPPQVALRPRVGGTSSRPQRAFVVAKNLYSRGASTLAQVTNGRLMIGSDLDVLCSSSG